MHTKPIKLWISLCLVLVGASTSYGADEGCEAGQRAFAKTLHPVLRAKCIACHDVGGIGPEHSAADIAVAYPIARMPVNFMDIGSSLFVKKVAQKHWLNYDDTAQGMLVSELAPLIQAWWDEGEAECEVSYAYKSGNLALPSDLPTRSDGKYTTLEWNLGDCALSVDVQEFAPVTETNLGAYRVKAPRITCTKAHHIEGLRFFVNGESEVFENIYDSVKVDIPASANVTTLSREGMILLRRSNKDTLSFGLRVY